MRHFAVQFSRFPQIRIGEGLAAFALLHHRAYGSVHGGSHSLHQRTVMIQEGKETQVGKETVRHCHFHRLHIRHGPGTFVRPSHGACGRVANPECPQTLIAGMAVFDPLLHDVAAEPPPDPAIQVPERRWCFNQPVITKPPLEVYVQLFDNLSQSDPPGPTGNLSDPVLDGL